MSSSPAPDTVEALAAAMTARGTTVAAAESLTSGALSTVLGRAPDTQQWYAGTVVAYQLATKSRVLGVDATIDPCSAECAAQLVLGVLRLMQCDYAVAVTGVGGPDADEAGHPAGTVYVAVGSRDDVRCRRHEFDGDPARVIEQSVDAALDLLAEFTGVKPVSGGTAPA